MVSIIKILKIKIGSPMFHLQCVSFFFLLSFLCGVQADGLGGRGDRYSLSLVLENDNPFLNLFPKIWAHNDDHGYTHGVKVNFEFVANQGRFKAKEYWQFHIGTELYTEDRTPAGENLFPHDPQVFNEITEWRVRWSDQFTLRKTPYFNWIGLGLGHINTRDDRGIAGIGQQRRWHDYKHHELTPTTTSMYVNQKGEGNDWYLIATFAKGQSISWLQDSFFKGSATVIVGVDAKTHWQASNLTLETKLNQSLFFGALGQVSVLFKNTINLHAKGQIESILSPQLSIRLMSTQIVTGINRSFGESNRDFYQYIDDDDIWFMKVVYYW
jgi:hypothetical protein